MLVAESAVVVLALLVVLVLALVVVVVAIVRSNAVDHSGEGEAAQQVQDAIKAVIAAGEIRTKDMGGSNSTSEVGDAVVKAFLAR